MSLVLTSVDQLNSKIEFDSPFRVTDVPGCVFTDLPNIYAPNSTDGELDSKDWEYWSNNRSNQYGYSGPIMHSSEILAGGMARDLLAEPGVYCLVVDESLCDVLACDCDHSPNGWTVVKYKKGE